MVSFFNAPCTLLLFFSFLIPSMRCNIERFAFCLVQLGFFFSLRIICFASRFSIHFSIRIRFAPYVFVWHSCIRTIDDKQWQQWTNKVSNEISGIYSKYTDRMHLQWNLSSNIIQWCVQQWLLYVFVRKFLGNRHLCRHNMHYTNTQDITRHVLLTSIILNDYYQVLFIGHYGKNKNSFEIICCRKWHLQIASNIAKYWQNTLTDCDECIF